MNKLIPLVLLVLACKKTPSIFQNCSNFISSEDSAVCLFQNNTPVRASHCGQVLIECANEHRVTSLRICVDLSPGGSIRVYTVFHDLWKLLASYNYDRPTVHANCTQQWVENTQP
jgi:hypothetical protein